MKEFSKQKSRCKIIKSSQYYVIKNVTYIDYKISIKQTVVLCINKFLFKILNAKRVVDANIKQKISCFKKNIQSLKVQICVVLIYYYNIIYRH